MFNFCGEDPICVGTQFYNNNNINNLRNAENSTDGQWDYLERGFLGTCSRDEWIMIYHRFIRILFVNYIVYYPFDCSYSFSL